MAVITSSDNCALGPDGKLLDASQIVWDYDPDPTIVPPGTQTLSSPPSTSQTVRNAFDVLTSHGHAQAKTVAGQRKSTRTCRPTQKMLENNTPRGNGKRKASPSSERHPAACKVAKNPSRNKHSDDVTDLDISDVDMDALDDSESETDDKSEVQLLDYDTMKSFNAGEVLVAALSKASRTQDVYLIFEKAEHTNPDTNVTQSGHICGICRRKQLPAKTYFMTGSVTSLRKHIARNKDHFAVYKDLCEKKGVSMNATAIPASSNDLSRRTMLDSVVVKQPTVEFSTAGLRDYIVELVVLEDKALRFVTRPSFQHLLQFCRPAIRDKDFICDMTLWTEILQRAESVINIIKAKITGVSGKVSTTFDLWTSDPCDLYMSITAHYIWAPEDHPNDWTLECEQLEFAPFFGHHSGANQAAVLTKAFEKFGIDRNKLGWQTADNASNNDTTLQSIATIINQADEGSILDSDDTEFWNASEHCIRCMEHCVHLAAGAFTKGITPTSSSNITVPDPEQPEDNGNKDLDEIDEFAPGDVVGKVLALIRQICVSPQAHAYFRKCCISTNNRPLELRLWIRTRWASLHDALDRVIVLEKAIILFTQTADDNESVPKLKNKSYLDYRMSRVDWDHLKIVHKVLSLPAQATQSFSSSRHPTLSKTIPTLEYMPLLKGIENIDKWYNKVDDSPAYFITLVLNPTIKLAYVSGKWHSDWVQFDKYYIQPQQNTPSNPSSSSASTSEFGHGWMMAAIQDRLRADAAISSDPRTELRRYLESPLEPQPQGEDGKINEFDVIWWWGHHQDTYPTLSRMARDYLAIQGSATPSERAFSSAGLTDHKSRNRLKPKMFAAIQTLKAAYRNGHISAHQQASEHVKDLQKALEEYYFGEDEDSESEGEESSVIQAE
ncbi:hypothetical protein D9758_015942 [Tetrapyrgos nigripes]|uniref:HAT C-terminal dimerisation domain-containing protein n=1 Tax=Tetrapyrgos nigripes TaxID=182062 RepID=A0A8H5FH69_9AGAR|nr:hypothetical protein D9758_015942 [Tetrapyrgos nigripes]